MALDFFTFTRNSEASTILQDGTLSNVAIDVPVINFLDGAFAGYYSQVAATNLVLRSEEFNNAYWTKTELNTTGTPPYINVAVAPDGTTTAEKLIPNTSDTSHRFSRNVTLDTGTFYTVSVFVKKGEYEYFQLVQGTSAGAGLTGRISSINLNDGSLVSETIVGQTAIESYGDGWYRVSLKTAQTTGSAGVSFFMVGFNNADFESFAGDGTSGIFLWGAQLETGSTATSYIKTVAATATREKDVATITNVADKLGLTAGSCQITSNFPTDYPLIVNGLQATVTGIKTIRFEYTTTTIELYVDNVLADSSTGTYDWSDLNEIQLGHYNGADQPNFELRDLIVRKA